MNYDGKVSYAHLQDFPAKKSKGLPKRLPKDLPKHEKNELITSPITRCLNAAGYYRPNFSLIAF